MSTIYDAWAATCLQLEDTEEDKVAIELQSDAREHFINLLSDNHQQDGSIIANELSNFIKKMEPSFSRGSNIRKYGLHCFLGALEGLGNSHFTGLPFSMMKLLSSFLLQHCGPIESTSFLPGDSMDIDIQNDGSSLEKVRDVSLSSIAALLQLPITGANDSSMDDFIELRIRVSQRGVQLRCASIEDCVDDDDDSYYEENINQRTQEEETKTLSGLSLLPRAKRSLCFRTLDAALSGIVLDGEKISNHTISVPLAQKMVSFAAFTAATLHGETDPRCLVLLLKLLKRVQEVLIPFVESKANFPFTQIFDSCAVYYPVRFSPPPNDPHRITREMISNALLEVFSCSSNLEKYILGDRNVNVHSNLTMQSLAVGLVLERMSPSIDAFSDDETNDVPTVTDRLDAIQDLKHLLFVSKKHVNQSNRTIMSLLSNDVVKDISRVLMKCHDEAATVVATNRNTSDCADNKRLADACRHLITSLVYEVELKQPTLWDSFVKDSVQSLSSVISSSPQSLKGRMAIAYLASISAGGGEKTLRYCLDMCIPSLFNIIDEGLKTEASIRDVEKISTAAYGVSTLFSSCRVSMEQISQDGINVYPHPLSHYATNAVQKLYQLFHRDENLEHASSFERNEVDVAAVKAFESVLQSTPDFLLVETCSGVVKESVFYLSNYVTKEYDNHVNDNFTRACSRLVGSMIGKALQKVNNETAKTESILESVEEVKTFAEQNLLPNILQSCFRGSKISASERLDFYAVAYACETDQGNATSTIVSSIYQTLVDTLKKQTIADKPDTIIPIADALSYVIKNGGPAATRSFHQASSMEENDILHHLAIVPNYKLKDEEAMEGMSNLLLPETKDHYRSEAQKAIVLADKILPCILDAYKSNIPEEKLLTVLSRISNVLPPLSDADEAELSVYLPVLGATLSSMDVLVTEEMMDKLMGLTPDLVDFSMNSDHNSVARSAASSCVYFSLSRFQRNISECRGLMILHDKLCPQLVSKIQLWSQCLSPDCINEIQDLFGMMSLIGCAAAWRGGISATTADEISRFLVLVACRGAACAPALGINDPIDFMGEASTDLITHMAHLAASALGTILNVKDGSPFARQRLAHLILPIILSSSDDQHLMNSSPGILLCAGHVVCCVPMSGITHDKLVELAKLLVSGLFKRTKSISDGNRTVQTNEEVVLTMTAIIRMYENFPLIMRTQLDTLVPTLVLLCISSTKPNESIINILSLQILLNLTKSTDATILYFCEAYKDTVITHLRKVLDHPSSQVRHAAVIVRNTWCVIGV
jgi:hypothetical protein